MSSDISVNKVERRMMGVLDSIENFLCTEYPDIDIKRRAKMMDDLVRVMDTLGFSVDDVLRMKVSELLQNVLTVDNRLVVRFSQCDHDVIDSLYSLEFNDMDCLVFKMDPVVII